MYASVVLLRRSASCKVNAASLGKNRTNRI